MKYLPLLIVLLLLSCETKQADKAASLPTRFENSQGTETATYNEVMEFYIQLAREFPEINIQTIGETDSGHPLHMVTYNEESDFNFQKIGQSKLVLLINNGIHPGESDGIDASMMLFRDYAMGALTAPENVVLVTIPVYNVGGALNRNSHTRVNQNGPESYGFRGNARNYDLNRDFIKNDSRNSQTFATIYHSIKPDIFIDTHVSNGADYQYTLTHLFSQPDKLGTLMGTYLRATFLPALEDSLSARGWDITPYVNVHGRPPDGGFTQFLDSPRYSTGYTALWGTLGVMLETHMLKPYKERVRATYDFLNTMVDLAEANHEKIRLLRTESRQMFRENTYYPLGWVVDSTLVSQLQFKGFEADTLLSQVTGLSRLSYDRARPFTKAVPYWDTFKPSDSVRIPQAYVIKKSWKVILEHLQRNQIAYSEFDSDSTLWVESYKIDKYNTFESPYEGHYPHYGTTVVASMDSLEVQAGDILVPTDQPGIRYLLEALEPAAVDSFFNWNYFDAILQQKEGISAYVFEDLAKEILERDPELKQALEEKRTSDPKFAQDAQAQLDFIYKNSPHYEEAHMQYPVYRLLK